MFRTQSEDWTTHGLTTSLVRGEVATKMASFSVGFRGTKKKLQKIEYLTKSKNYFEDITLESAHIYGSHKNLSVSCTFSRDMYMLFLFVLINTHFDIIT